MATSANYSLNVGVNILKGDAQRAINEAFKDVKVPNLKFDSGSTDSATQSTKHLGDSVRQTGQEVESATLTWQQYREMLDKSIDVMKSFAEQTYEMDSALTELKKVSDLQGESLNKYVSSLTEAGKQVARTGKPNRSEPE